ncbi:MAG: hypothetical protein AAFX54_00345 [Pseudomonadota bacterium]
MYYRDKKNTPKNNNSIPISLCAVSDSSKNVMARTVDASIVSPMQIGYAIVTSVRDRIKTQAPKLAIYIAAADIKINANLGSTTERLIGHPSLDDVVLSSMIAVALKIEYAVYSKMFCDIFHSRSKITKLAAA